MKNIFQSFEHAVHFNGSRTMDFVLVDRRAVLMLQTDVDGASLAGVVVFFAAIWDIRAMTKRNIGFGTHAHAAGRFGWTMLGLSTAMPVLAKP